MMDSSYLESLELPQEKFPQTWKILKSGIQEGVAPGFVAGLWSTKNPDQIYVCAQGQRRLVPSIQPMQVNTCFDLASVTKVFATATLTAVLIDRGWLSWGTSVSSIFPSYPYPKIEIRHLLSHTAGFVAWHPFWEEMRHYFFPQALEAVSIQRRQNRMKERILALAPDAEVGTQTLYSDISFILLGFLLEEVTQMPLDHAVRRFVWQPMGVRGASFRRVTRSVVDAVDESAAATEDCPWRGGVVQGQVHDDNCWAMGGYAGHAGAFGSARDLLYFSKKLMEGFISPIILKQMWTRVSLPAGCTRTLGWDTPSGDLPAASLLFSSQSVGHLGFSGTSLWIDPAENLAVVLLSNRIHPSRDNIKIREFRSHFHKAIWLEQLTF